MRNSLFQKITFASLILGVAIITSCGDDGGGTAVPAPDADFTSSIDGKTVTFTDASTDAETYAWDFGDGSTSEEASPTHTYEANGSYVAKLTVTNESGEDTKQEVLEIINITIDGDLADWADVPVLAEHADGEGGFLRTLKVENLENNKIFIYVEADENMVELNPDGNVIQIMLDTDNDPTTGRGISWYWFEAGEDYLIEGTLLGAEASFSLFQNNPESDKGLWDATSWQLISDVKDDYIVASELQTISGGFAYELSIDLASLPTEVSSEAIRIGVQHSEAWGANSFIPQQFNAESCAECSMASYSF